MNTLPFPPIMLTYITKDNALFHGACITGINQVIDTHQLSHLTAISVSLLLKSKKLTPDEIYLIKSIAGLNINGEEDGESYGDGYEWGDGDGEGCGDGCNDGHGDGYGYGYGCVNGDGEGIGNGSKYGN